ncbi:hypothetical protein SAMD00019534_031930, partial [Acytostelium subglobosum LB1]|uniref:hypothetical protein n=1 Tax=Acytostelium subglobosum LB1 TaxID=1410327 RepID=UPI0006448B9E
TPTPTPHPASFNKYTNTIINNYNNMINIAASTTTATITKTEQLDAVTEHYKPKATIVSSDNVDNIKRAAEKIRNGGLVGFPTETVYGLGANAFDKDAVLSIFTAKGRPLTDPVIVHVVNAEFAATLLELSPRQRQIFDRLATTFWPGALTIVAKASSLIPMIVTAQTGFVGVRYPMHDVAASLIKEAGVPIAAPSANRFGHVSPTSAMHVFDDLGQSDITILDTDIQCKIGIESTVLKLVDDENLVILRKGGVSERAIKSALSCDQFQSISITSVSREVSNTTTQGQEAPGQLLTHYAPDIQAYILTDIFTSTSSSQQDSSPCATSIPLSQCVYIDFGNSSDTSIVSKFIAYRDLSPNSTMLEAANCLFSTLRWSESIDGAKVILLPDLRADKLKSLDNIDAVFDRIYRAASGKTAQLDLVNQRVLI